MSHGGVDGGASIADALHEFEKQGYSGQFRAESGGRLECLACHALSAAERVSRTALRRVEGSSDPDDMVSVNALVCPSCGSRGTAVFGYGVHATAEEGEVLSRLNPVHAKRHQDRTPGAAALLHPTEAETPDMPSDFDDEEPWPRGF